MEARRRSNSSEEPARAGKLLTAEAVQLGLVVLRPVHGAPLPYQAGAAKVTVHCAPSERITVAVGPRAHSSSAGSPSARRSAFESIDRPAMKQLPARRHEVADWKKTKVNIDYHVMYDDRSHSAQIGSDSRNASTPLMTRSRTWIDSITCPGISIP